MIGSLVTFNSIVVRTSDVRPMLKVACLECEVCGAECFQTVDGKNFMPLFDCPAPNCQQNNTKGNLILNTRSSFFVNYQEIKCQEPSHEVPIGHVPKTITVYALAQTVRKCSPGDAVIIQGIFLPSEFENMYAKKNELICVYR